MPRNGIVSRTRPGTVKVAELSRESQENAALCVLLMTLLDAENIDAEKVRESLFFNIDWFENREVYVAGVEAFERLRKEGKL